MDSSRASDDIDARELASISDAADGSAFSAVRSAPRRAPASADAMTCIDVNDRVWATDSSAAAGAAHTTSAACASGDSG